MYPLQFAINGIRDFAPRSLELGGADGHVLVGGKNGAGKSTLVFALAFALGSPRVSVDGLRSKMRREGWRARVAVLFHNPPGENQKDAPEYVELAAEVRLVPGSERRQVRYFLFGGPDLDRQLAILRQFSTRSEAQDYYKRVFDIDAEGYFMFWYQGSIAEFANMSDAVRFERVAAMFGLDELQREWELARRQMKEAEEDFERARTVAITRTRRLQELEKLKNALEKRDALRRDALLQMETVYREMLALVRAEGAAAGESLAAARRDHAAAAAERDGLEQGLREIRSTLDNRREARALKEEEARQTNALLAQLNGQLATWQGQCDELNKKVRDLEEKMKYIHRNRDELLGSQGALQRDLAELDRDLAELDAGIAALDEKQAAGNRELGGVERDRQRVEAGVAEKQDLDGRLPPEAQLAAEEATLREERDVLVQERGRLDGEKKRLAEEGERLAGQKTLLLPAQEKLLRTYREAGIRAAAFGELFDVRDDAPRDQVETWLAPLKHTVFVERLLERVPVEKGFYVVALPARRSRFAARRSNLLDYLAPGDDVPADFLARVEQWLANVELGPDRETVDAAGRLVLCGGVLWDRFGVRGAVEAGAAIGVKALEAARRRAAAELAAVEARAAAIDARLAELDGLARENGRLLAQRRDVDQSLPALREERAALRAREAALRDEVARSGALLLENRRRHGEESEEKTKKEQSLRQVEGELAVYAEYQREQETISRLKELEKKIGDAEARREVCRRTGDGLEREIDAVSREIRAVEQHLQESDDRYRLAASRVQQLDAAAGELEERYGALAIEAQEWQDEYDRMHAEFAAVIDGLVGLGQWLPPVYREQEKTRTNLQRRQSQAREQLDEALSRAVTENARQQYDDYSFEYNQAQKEFEESRLRFDQLRAREQERRQDFHKNVTYRWQRTNQRFCAYMERLNMVGEVRLVPPEEDSRRPVYQWELHVATRPGHRPEKIFPESGRIVGEGISGGERAAVSLVFALALLSDIENRPPFYVLDEFDSALDEERKHDIFELYRSVLGRKLVIVSPKVHGDQYLNHFHKFLCVVGNPGAQPGEAVSEVYDVTRQEYHRIRAEEEGTIS